MRVTSRRTTTYAVLAALLVVLVVMVDWFTTPRTSGLEGQWETEAVRGDVLGGRALVATGSNVAIDLVTGTRITLGSVAGGERAVGAGRLLILHDAMLDGAGLDGRSRWTWQGPPAHTLAFVAAGTTTTVVQACGGTPTACRLIGVGTNGTQSWQTPQPTATGTSRPVVGEGGSLPTVGVLAATDGTLLLVDPDTSRVVLRPAAATSVGRDGVLILGEKSGGECVRTTFETFDRTSVATTPGPCTDTSANTTPATLPGGERVVGTRSDVWWWPFGDGRPTLEVSAGPTLRMGRHTARVVSRDALRSLRADDTGITVLDGDTVRRYTWQR
ncbi:hypothetical protein [Knoellia sp. Soil729]|uniref:hypothetical protein n=1 Tax=Knoellia sp. Soil729 TaxID=1736394 RepID=UPI0006FFD2EF|nr:hypothetical protein [Knoellia sp. Soil729]KRE44132.1 hypothetical protein ASG74_04770 [Knoellia sp. Soil729]